jgi:hypothetical protein
MDKKLVLIREPEDQQTLGKLYVLENNSYSRVTRKFDTLELPWIDNKQFISCIPAGLYKCKKIHSKTFGWCIDITHVEGRYDVRIHFGNYKRNTKGCILAGNGVADIDKDGLRDVLYSKDAMSQLNSLLPEEFFIEIL